MKIFLAAVEQHLSALKEYNCIGSLRDMLILESFYYLRKTKNDLDWIVNSENFLLDSGAFTFMQQSNLACDFDRYTEEYAAFINKYDVKYFFELDIDSVVGLQKTEILREKLERLTGKKPIPVWHLSRGKEYFEWMCKNYSYVAFGGILTDGLSSKTLEKYFPWFIKTAHKYGARIHALGYTSVNLKNYAFDSADSTSWKHGNLNGSRALFLPNEKCIKSINKPKNTRALNYKKLLAYNFSQWLKFQKFAETNM